MRFNRCFILIAFIAAGCASEAEKKTMADDLTRQGQVCQADNKTDDAAKKYEAALRQDPKNATALHELAALRTTQKKYEVATPLWRRYVEATNGSADAWNDMAYCQDLAGWAAPTEGSYLKALEANPNHRRAHINYGLFLARHDRCPEAICQLQLALPPAQAHYDLGIALDEVGKASQARAEYRKALKLQPEFPEADARLRQSVMTSARVE